MKDRFLSSPLKVVLAIFALVVLVLVLTIVHRFSDASIGVALLGLFLLGCIMPYRGNKPVIIVSLATFTIAKLYSLYFGDPVIGPDATRYYSQTIQFNDFESFWEYVKLEFDHYGLMGMSSYVDFGLLYFPFYDLLGLYDPNAILVFNTLILIFTVYLFSEISVRAFSSLTEKQLYALNTVVITAFFISPTVNYWSSMFLKDITSLFTVTLAFYLFVKRRYLLFLPVLLFATMMRPYAVVVLLLFWGVINSRVRPRILILSLIPAGLIVVVQTGITGLFNSVPTMFRVLASPVFFNKENWESFPLATTEGLVVTAVSIFAIINMATNKRTRKFYLSFLLALILYSMTLTVVGYAAIDYRGFDYELFSGGDDFFRKKLPFMPLIFVMTAYTAVTFTTRPHLLGLPLEAPRPISPGAKHSKV